MSVFEDSGIHRWQEIPSAALDQLLDIGEARTAQKKGYVSADYMDPLSHEVGVIGEWWMGYLLNQPFSKSIDPLGDKGFDFLGNIDVKSTRRSPPWLKVEVKKAMPGRKFALVHVCEHLQKVRYLGFATSETLKAARTPEQLTLRSDLRSSESGLPRSDKFGPLSFILRPADYCHLTRALPLR